MIPWRGRGVEGGVPTTVPFPSFTQMTKTEGTNMAIFRLISVHVEEPCKILLNDMRA